MQKLKNYEQLLNKIKEEKYFLLYVSMNNCSICHADMPKVEKIVNKKKLLLIILKPLKFLKLLDN